MLLMLSDLALTCDLLDLRVCLPLLLTLLEQKHARSYGQLSLGKVLGVTHA